MRWVHYPVYFFFGSFLANCLPHLGNGISELILLLGAGILLWSWMSFHGKI